MFNLDRMLRTQGSRLLMQRAVAQMLVDRAFEVHSEPRGPFAFLSRFGRRRSAEREGGGEERNAEAPPEHLAVAPIRYGTIVESGEGYAIVDGVAIIDIRGCLTPDGYYDWWDDCWTGGYTQIGESIATARADGRVRGLFVRVDSPGGIVDGCFDLADQIRAGRAKEGGKPLWVHTTMACSAAYALAAGADRIIATPEADVGSIGVLILHVDMSGMLEQWGLKVEAIESAPRKTVGAPWRPLSDEDRDHFQSIVSEIANWFIAVVVAGRGLSVEAIKAQQALWFMARHSDPKRSGQTLGLVDEIATEAAAFDAFVNSLSGETGTGAPAGTGNGAADPAARADMEKDMPLKDQIAALRTKAAAGDAKAKVELEEMGISLMATAATAAAEPNEEDEDAAEDGDTEKEPEAKAKGHKAGFALLSRPEAKGREALAQQLGAKVADGRLTYGDAKELLAVAPKASRLAETMQGRDQNPGASAGAPKAEEISAGWDKAISSVNSQPGVKTAKAA